MERDTPLLHDMLSYACIKHDKMEPYEKLANALDVSSKEQDTMFHPVANNLRRARRFLIDDSLVERASYLAAADPRFLLRSLPSSLPPYDLSWFEWNEDARMNVMMREGHLPFLTEDRAKRMGVLVERLNRPNTDTLYRISVVAGHLNGISSEKVTMYPVGFLCDFEKVNFGFAMTSEEHVITGAMGRFEKQLEESVALGGTYMKTFIKTEEDRAVALELAYHVRYCPTGPIGNLFLKQFQRYPHDSQKFIENAGMGINGDFRFLISVLTLLNTFALQIGEGYRVSPKGSKFVGGKSRPYMAYNRLILELPKEKLLNAVEEYVGDQINDSRRRHEVMPTWCYRKNSGRIDCDHEWDRMEERTSNIWHKCKHCGRIRWRRKEHERGDASKGFVVKDYILTANGDRRAIKYEI